MSGKGPWRQWHVLFFTRKPVQSVTAMFQSLHSESLIILGRMLECAPMPLQLAGVNFLSLPFSKHLTDVIYSIISWINYIQHLAKVANSESDLIPVSLCKSWSPGWKPEALRCRLPGLDGTRYLVCLFIVSFVSPTFILCLFIVSLHLFYLSPLLLSANHANHNIERQQDPAYHRQTTRPLSSSHHLAEELDSSDNLNVATILWNLNRHLLLSLCLMPPLLHWQFSYDSNNPSLSRYVFLSQSAFLFIIIIPFLSLSPFLPSQSLWLSTLVFPLLLLATLAPIHLLSLLPVHLLSPWCLTSLLPIPRSDPDLNPCLNLGATVLEYDHSPTSHCVD